MHFFRAPSRKAVQGVLGFPWLSRSSECMQHVAFCMQGHSRLNRARPEAHFYKRSL